mgnify:CR=1 FL=1
MVINAALDAGRDPPASILPPELDPEDSQYISWFWDLCRDRTFTSGGPASIPWSSCHQYAVVEGFTRYEDMYLDFMHAIRELDSEYLAVAKEETARQKAKAEAKRR